MRELVLTPRFKRAFRRWVGKNPAPATNRSCLAAHGHGCRRPPAENASPERPIKRTPRLFGRLRLPDCFCPTETLHDRRGSAAAGQHWLARRSLLNQGMTMKNPLSILCQSFVASDFNMQKLLIDIVTPSALQGMEKSPKPGPVTCVVVAEPK